MLVKLALYIDSVMRDIMIPTYLPSVSLPTHTQLRYIHNLIFIFDVLQSAVSDSFLLRNNNTCKQKTFVMGFLPEFYHMYIGLIKVGILYLYMCIYANSKPFFYKFGGK